MVTSSFVLLASGFENAAAAGIANVRVKRIKNIIKDFFNSKPP